jgi:hypothetical protein
VTTRLPPPGVLPTLRPREVFTVGTSETFGRLYFTAGAHPAAWDSFREFGPVSTMRFDHHTPPPRIHPSRAISYVAPARGRRRRRFDPLHACVRECFALTDTIDLRAGAPWFVLWASVRPLRLLDVVDSPWIARAGGNAAISSGARGMSRRWARAIYRTYTDIDGIFYESSTLPSARSVALFDRSRDALPISYTVAFPLTHPGLRNPLKRLAYEYDMNLVL